MHKLPTNLLVICSQQSDWTSSLFPTEKTPPWHNIQNKHQWGFRPQRSTEDALLYMTTKWRKAINSGKVIRILFINFKKFRAHQILLKKLRSIRRLLFLPWELSPRPQAEYHCWQSYLKYCRCWLRCNSLVSPPCFSVYVNDLQEKLKTVWSTFQHISFLIIYCLYLFLFHIWKHQSKRRYTKNYDTI